MTDENTMNKLTEPSTTVPPAPNGHGASNGLAKANATSSSKKKTKKKAKKKKSGQQQAKPTSAPADSKETGPTDSPAPSPAAETTATAGPLDEAVAAPTTDPAEVVASTEELPAEPTAHAEPELVSQAEVQVENLRLRMKVWTDPTTSKRYLMPSAFMRDVVNGQPVSDVMYAYAMRDDSTKIVTLTAAEWNALPFSHFQEDGSAPRAASRPLDDVPVTYAKTT